MKAPGVKKSRKVSVMQNVIREEWNARFGCNDEAALPSFMDRLEDPYIPFHIDRFFKGKTEKLLRPNFQSNLPTQMLRRCVEVALNAALSANQQRIYEVAMPDWREGSKLADDALAALDRLFNWMSAPHPSSWRTKDREKSLAAIASSARHATFLRDLAPQDRDTHAISAARSIIEARSFIAQMSEAYEMHRTSLVTQYIGEVEKTAFVRILAEGWLCLCGEIPAQTGSDFSGFVWEAWLDVCQEYPGSASETFAHTIREVSKEMTAQRLPRDWQAEWFW